MSPRSHVTRDRGETVSRQASRTGRQRVFAEIEGPGLQRSVLPRSHGHKLTCETDRIVPVFVDEVIPGDTMTLRPTFFGRLNAMLNPIMDNLYLDWFFFFVPNRILWENWQKFLGEQENPGDPTEFVVPTTGLGQAQVLNHSLFDYFGMPPLTNAGFINCLPFRAYNMIYNEWFRPQELIPSQPKNMDDGPDPATDFKLMKRAKRHDYFTSCTVAPQRGDPVEIGFAANAPVIPDPVDSTPTYQFNTNGNHSDVPMTVLPPAAEVFWNVAPTGSDDVASWTSSGLVADLQSVQATTINEIRQAFQFQKLLERDARGGTRYRELLLSHFGVTTDDARLQRPEFLTHGTTPLLIREVPKTAESGTDPQASLAAYGTLGASGRGFKRSFTEHGYIIGLISIRADLHYMQGIERMWYRSFKYDFYWPALAHLGEQAVLNQEIFLQDENNIGASGIPINKEVFGYQERWAEMRYKPSRTSGNLRGELLSNATLSSWHLAEEFADLPRLNQIFIESNTPIDRVTAVPVTNDKFLVDCWFDYECIRPMPTHSTPGLIDHF